MKEATLDQGTKILSVFKDTPAEQIQEMLASGGLADLRDADFSRFNREEHRRVCGLRPVVSALLEPIGTLAVPAVKNFSVRKSFVVNTSAKAAVRISYLSDNFVAWFGDKTELNVPAETLRYAKLLRLSLNKPIRNEIGKPYEETKLAHIYILMTLQPNGEDGALLSDGRANIFYAVDITGSVRAVGVSWIGDGWDVHAISVSGPFEWGDGRRVFSRNSLDAVAI